MRFPRMNERMYFRVLKKKGCGLLKMIPIKQQDKLVLNMSRKTNIFNVKSDGTISSINVLISYRFSDLQFVRSNSRKALQLMNK